MTEKQAAELRSSNDSRADALVRELFGEYRKGTNEVCWMNSSFEEARKRFAKALAALSPTGDDGDRADALVEAAKPFADFADALAEHVPDDIGLGIFAGGAMHFGPSGGACVGDLRKVRAALSRAPSGAVIKQSPVGSYDDGVEAEIQDRIEYHERQAADADGCDYPESARYHERFAKDLSALLATVRSLKQSPSGAVTSGDGYRTLARPWVPEGWALVPIETTEEMRRAGAQEKAMTFQRVQTAEDGARDIYRAMLLAAPSPPSQRSEAERSSPSALEGGAA